MRIVGLFALAALGALTSAYHSRTTGRVFVSRGTISTLTVLPGESVTLDVGGRRWDWTAPRVPGLYPIEVDSITVQAFVLTPASRMRGEYLNGYRIGRYPTKPLRGLDIYRAPGGFIEITRANENTFVSPHFQLKQFVCKQGGAYPRYVVLNEQLIERLETLLAIANDAGINASTFHVMSGYRTPAYNRAIGNVPYSRHTWGSAADIFVDSDRDGRMDDLNRDGESDIRDAEILYRLFEGPQASGGMGKYEPTAAHGPFVHVDVRDRRARW